MLFVGAEMVAQAHSLKIEKQYQEYLVSLRETALAEMRASAHDKSAKAILRDKIWEIPLDSCRAEAALLRIRSKIGPSAPVTDEKTADAAERAMGKRRESDSAWIAHSAARQMMA